MKSKILGTTAVTLLIAAGLILGGQTPAADLGGPERYLTHVSTDKPIYRPGEKLYVRGVVLRADGHSPMPSSGTAFVEIKGPKGETVTSAASSIIDSTIGFSWDIPASQPGGEYTALISHPLTGDAPAQRKFDIRTYRAPRLKTQIVFVRDGYGPGDTVATNLHADRAEGGVPLGARVSISARVDGEEVWKGSTTVDASGNAGASFALPAAIARGEGTIAMIIEDGGTVETATKTIPILLQTLDLSIYPEGGDLVAGLPTRVFVEGKTPNRKPADMAGSVVNAAGKEIAAFRTEHEGRGRFAITPVKGETYSLRINEPAGIKTIFKLPAVRESGAVIASTTDISAKGKDVVVRVAATADGAYEVALSQHGKEIASTSTALKANRPADINFTVPKSVDGVIVATVYDDRNTPLAERLLFRQPEHNLHVHVTADQADFTPGDKVTLRISTTDDRDKPVGAVVGLHVTDSSVLEMIEKREQAPRLPVMVLLENDVRDLADAHVYLDETNPKAPIATNLLLGTQGWRRFATVDPAKFLAANGDAARRALAIRMVTDADRGRANSMRPVAAPGVGVGFGGGIGGGVVGGRVGAVGGGGRGGGAPAPVAQVQPVPAPRAMPADAAVAEKARGNANVVLGNEVEVLVQAQAAVGAVFAADRIFAAPPVPGIRNITVREYAHALRPNWTEGSRSDFAETVYWNAGIKTDATTGLATVSFNLSDSVTSFKVMADGFTPDGTLGSGSADIESVKPFNIEPKFPLQVTSGDVIQLPIAVINGRNRDLGAVEFSSPTDIAGLQFVPPANNGGTLGAKERSRRLMQIDIGRDFSGFADFTLAGKAGAYRDSVSRKIDVQPMGFPYESNAGGVLDSNSSHSFEFTLPAGMVPGSFSSNIVVYPTPLASMTEALQALLRQPNGCFEQTSSTSYPMVMAQQYFLTHSGIEPGIIENARTLLDISYKKLIGFESRTKGYEWFGADPGHEALTAYGLMQFTDMSHVRDVDKDMVQRTREWLLARRDGNGGFNRNAKALDSFGRAPEDTTNAYITWALVESGEKNLAKEISGVKASANSTQDSYILALAANILYETGDKAGSQQLMDRLARSQDSVGIVKGARTSITQSGGAALDIEATSLTVLAWLHEPSYAPNVERAVKWLIESNKNGRFGSTQSTILALRAVVAYDAARAHPKAPGRIVLIVDDKAVGAPVSFTANTQGAIVMPGIGKDLGPGKHVALLRMEDGSNMPFSMSVKYYSALPDSAEQTKISIQVSLKDPRIQEGNVTEATVSITNKSDDAIPTPVAIVGIPGGLEVRHDQLKELVKSGKIDAYEVIGREVILYWRGLKAKARFDIPLSLVAAVPGTYTGPASRAYLYYTDEFKNWAPAMKVSITPR